MSWPLVLAFLWLIAANVIAMFPSRDNHWRNAYALIAIGVPILGLVTWQDGPVWGMLLLLGAASVLRWPLVYLWRHLSPRPQRR
ncbi:MAG: hypothetical protein A3D16_01490 [Rhodobacterales bacterium RIFCSPHIGHO2_02_FULL_62_130]|jgi:hypothetical protein|nr:MAG: hypothetical protein A3D16_01490 [Rhodobacterales bacterium RIFCSPHIGHO2_02_FULL_62_130]OHC55130.1 MAG: hypothetical protein A3E48_11135 [Rhodobacterales bacterium RIFCSPHIGHO2_12_FULL_62_75]HCZ00435.1 hypothetical protein [Rhodobacter sp.]